MLKHLSQHMGLIRVAWVKIPLYRHSFYGLFLGSTFVCQQSGAIRILFCVCPIVFWILDCVWCAHYNKLRMAPVFGFIIKLLYTCYYCMLL